MLSTLRKSYNAAFTAEKYAAFLAELQREFGHPVLFRVAETPVFLPLEYKDLLLQACEEVFETICRPDFKSLTEGALSNPEWRVPGEDGHTVFMQVDFGVCEAEDGSLIPQMIEIQGFPSLYCFQAGLGEAYRQCFDIPGGMSTFFNGYDKAGYLDLLREVIVGDGHPEHTVLLEIEPEKQGTNIDFYASAKYLGLKVLDLQDLQRSGRELYYTEGGRKIPVHRIYNRVIFDELEKRTDLRPAFRFQDEADVHWVGHPNWFFRISKYTLPLFRSRFVPESYYLDHLTDYPADLEHYVLKPLFSFAGMGVKINITRQDLDEVPEASRSNYILQRKVHYKPVIETPDVPAKCEIRMMVIWKPGWERPKVVNNICRLSKGEMVGVRYNKDKTWVGGTVCFF